MTIYSITFNKGDYAYSIAYHERNDDMQLDTNEEALNSMKLAIEALKEAVREYASIDYSYDIRISKVTFGSEKKDNSIKFYAISNDKNVFPPKLITLSMNIPALRKKEKDIETTRARILLNIEGLYGEVEKYLNGNRSQETFNFDDDLDDASLEDTNQEEDKPDLPEQIDSWAAGDIDLFN